MGRRVVLGLLVIAVGFLGLTSFNIVSRIWVSSKNAKSVAFFKLAEMGDSENIKSIEKSMDFSKEVSEFSPDNLGDELALDYDTSLKKFEQNVKTLDFSSIEAFLYTYESLIGSVVGDVIVDSFYYVNLRSTVVSYTVDNLEVIVLADGSIYMVTIKDFEESIEEYVNEEGYDIFQVDGDTIISFVGGG